MIAPTFGVAMIAAKETVSDKTHCSSDEALHNARLDAESVYGDLDGYRIAVVLEPDGWHVDFELKDTNLEGGGPHYVIDAASGAIVSKRYEQ
jgi:hypothetical protein